MVRVVLIISIWDINTIKIKIFCSNSITGALWGRSPGGSARVTDAAIPLPGEHEAPGYLGRRAFEL